MPTLPLLDAFAPPDAWHQLASPGSYEWWYFDAEDARTDTQVVAIFMEGFIFHPTFIRKHEKFRRKPTRHAPVRGSDFPCVYLCVYHNKRIHAQFFTQYPPGSMRASSTSTDVTIGPNRLTGSPQTGYDLTLTGTPWTLTARGPITHRQQSLSAQLHFRPRVAHEPVLRTFLSKTMTGADHRWAICAPMCDVKGTVQLNSDRSQSHPIDGRGYHDHNFGSELIGPGLHRWTWGRAIFDDRVITFHHAEPRDKALPPETHVCEVDHTGQAAEKPVSQVHADWSARCRPAMNLAYPKSLRFGDALELTNPTILDPAPFYMRLTYDARAGTKTTRAFCELAYPGRLRWPLLGRLIEMSFDKRL
jgi:carotenoid 1,2-hydratase